METSDTLVLVSAPLVCPCRLSRLPREPEKQSAFAILVMQLWLLMNRESINESINTVHFVAPTSLDSITIIVIRHERLHGFHEMRLQFAGSPG